MFRWILINCILMAGIDVILAQELRFRTPELQNPELRASNTNQFYVKDPIASKLPGINNNNLNLDIDSKVVVRNNNKLFKIPEFDNILVEVTTEVSDKKTTVEIPDNYKKLVTNKQINPEIPILGSYLTAATRDEKLMALKLAKKLLKSKTYDLVGEAVFPTIPPTHTNKNTQTKTTPVFPEGKETVYVPSLVGNFETVDIVNHKPIPVSHEEFPAVLRIPIEGKVSPFQINQIYNNRLDMIPILNNNRDGIDSSTVKSMLPLPSRSKRRVQGYVLCANTHRNRVPFQVLPIIQMPTSRPVFQSIYNFPRNNPFRTTHQYRNSGVITEIVKPFLSFTDKGIENVFTKALSDSWHFGTGFRILKKPNYVGGSNNIGNQFMLANTVPLNHEYQPNYILHRQPSRLYSRPNSYKADVNKAILKIDKVVKFPPYFINKGNYETVSPTNASKLSNSVKITDEASVNNSRVQKDDIPKTPVLFKEPKVNSSFYKQINHNNKSNEFTVVNVEDQITERVNKSNGNMDSEVPNVSVLISARNESSLNKKTDEDFKEAPELNISSQAVTDLAIHVNTAPQQIEAKAGVSELTVLSLNAQGSLKTSSMIVPDEINYREMDAEHTSINIQENDPDNASFNVKESIDTIYDKSSNRGDIPNTVVK